jgi:hypothetical protein
MLSNLRGKLNLRKNRQTREVPKDDPVHYFDAKHFFNDLENQEDYYLKITPGKEHEFVRKDEVNRPN